MMFCISIVRIMIASFQSGAFIQLAFSTIKAVWSFSCQNWQMFRVQHIFCCSLLLHLCSDHWIMDSNFLNFAVGIN